MIIKTYKTEEEWLDDRKARITGSKLKDLAGVRGGRKIGFYQLIADRIALYEDGGTSDRDRGHRLEVEAVGHLSDLVGVDFITDLCLWVRSDNDSMAYSPDGYNRDLSVAVEVKCLGSARHIQAIIENKIPEEFMPQVIQAFIVNDDLQVLYFTFYDPRLTARPLHVIERTRDMLVDEIAWYRDFEERTLKQINDYVEELAF